jgi:sigma-B regulation protein RsbU (phosphoserine phosphatase)
MHRELTAKNAMIAETLGELQVLYDSIDADLLQAKKIQESLVPELTRSFGASRVSLLLKPCGHIGGDLVGMFSPGADQLAFYSIDVSGHGITSAMMTARLGSYLSSAYLDQNLAIERRDDRSYALLPPGVVAGIMNDRLLADTGIEEYFTMAYCTIDLRSGALQMAQSGHPHPLLIRKSGVVEFVGEGGLPIGLIPDIPVEQFGLQLAPGDKLLLYSDGFTECLLRNGEMLEPEGLVRLVESCPVGQEGQEFLDDLFWRLTQEMAPGQGLEDDVSAALFEYEGP